MYMGEQVCAQVSMHSVRSTSHPQPYWYCTSFCFGVGNESLTLDSGLAWFGHIEDREGGPSTKQPLTRPMRWKSKGASPSQQLGWQLYSPSIEQAIMPWAQEGPQLHAMLCHSQWWDVWHASEDRKSTFQAFAAKVSNQGQVNWVPWIHDQEWFKIQRILVGVNWTNIELLLEISKYHLQVSHMFAYNLVRLC